MTAPRLSALVVVHNEEGQLAECLSRLKFADEIVVVLDRCTDASEAIASASGARILAGAWPLEGPRRNDGIATTTGEWVLEVDADERVTPELAGEIRELVATSAFDWHLIPVDNYIGRRRVRYGWGGSYGKGAYPGLFRRHAKKWGDQRVHPALRLEGRIGGRLRNRLVHHVDRNISDMIHRLDRYTTLRAADLRDSGEIGSLGSNIRRFFTRFWKCFVSRKGYREGAWGALVALMAALYPLLSHLKARLEDNEGPLKGADGAP